MGFSVHAYSVPKAGNSPDEYEDAYAFSADNFRFALADGATESSFADIWARSLVKQFSAEPPAWGVNDPAHFRDWLTPLQKQWHNGIRWERLPWFAEEKARRGAFAALVGMEFAQVVEPAPNRPPVGATKEPFWKRLLSPRRVKPPPGWRAVAVGDSCFFQVRNHDLLTSFPLTRADQFNQRPTLLSSNPSSNHPVWSEVRRAEGACEFGDFFLFASDALAQWILARVEQGDAPWEELETVRSDADFSDFVSDARASGALKNDDTTVMFFRWTRGKPTALDS